VQIKGYLVFHLNLAFSSIEEKARPDVIKTCYHPLLQLVEQTGIPIGIELTGWTLKQIKKIDPTWIERFQRLLRAGSCELIGSGYCQIIAPLVPSTVNEWNQQLGILEYENLLGFRPNIALVNEMAYSNSLVELYTQFGYQGFIMDRDNVRSALDINKVPIAATPTHAQGVSDTVLPVLWGDSILFQKMQHVAHGDISFVNYLDYLKKRIGNGEKLIPIYCNDTEVFDYRPGRFSEERSTHPDGEWRRIKKLLKSISTEIEIQWISPTQALNINNQITERRVSRLTTAAYPIPVKKQKKYNIARWAVTGRNDLWLNTMCHRIAKHLSDTKNNNPADWQELCELWASDLRTHITQKRWDKAKQHLHAFMIQHNISESWGVNFKQPKSYDSLEKVTDQYGETTVTLGNEGILLSISTNKIQVALNLRRGLTIHSLGFASHGMKPCIGALAHGYFSSISLGADFYSGGVIVELPMERKRITDLESISPRLVKNKNNDLEVYTTIPTTMGDINKVICISSAEEKITIKYNFPKWKRPIGLIRLGIITLLPEIFDDYFSVSCVNGGRYEEVFTIDSTISINHGKASSTLVSCSRGFGATEGVIHVNSRKNTVRLDWDPANCAVMPMLQHENGLSRIFFSMLEIDDTARESSSVGSFELTISGFKNNRL
jgi:hypothetical protein